ncbi:MAG: P-loop NTPase fold protein [Candidatus Thermoplasmatota archaeon]|jgi:LAO/AO transport system kinase|nr:P-loop NTPase fold protein [Candidatus Thermoplasmatota archaeon]MCL5790307.1 P-loop NTPase fold protein [Candidatus Thermoplasmatota archaeon]
MPKLSELVTSAEGGNRRDIGRLISIIENRSHGYSSLLKMIKKRKSSIFVVGITGPPGVGKSSLISKLAVEFSRKERLAVIMIDATSPYSGGSLLGNRLRLESTVNTYVRSMATRGSTGGLNLALGDSIDLLSYLGFTMVLVESVGTGQDETDILHYSDRIVMVLSPGMGDQVQAIKAGQMEIGDFVVLNKGDKPEAIIAEKELLETISIPDSSKKHSFVKVSALTGEGIKELADMIISSRMEKKLGDTSLNREKERLMRELFAILKSNDEVVERYAKDVVKGKLTRDEAAGMILKDLRER